MSIILNPISAAQLRNAADLQEKIELLRTEFDDLLSGSVQTKSSASSALTLAPVKSGGMSAAAGRVGIAAAQRARWARQRGETVPAVTAKRVLSPEGRANIIAATKARWARIRGQAPVKASIGSGSRRVLSPEQKAKIAAIARRRWKKARAEGRNTL
jgi:hypothetical protein